MSLGDPAGPKHRDGQVVVVLGQRPGVAQSLVEFQRLEEQFDGTAGPVLIDLEYSEVGQGGSAPLVVAGLLCVGDALFEQAPRGVRLAQGSVDAGQAVQLLGDPAEIAVASPEIQAGQQGISALRLLAVLQQQDAEHVQGAHQFVALAIDRGLDRMGEPFPAFALIAQPYQNQLSSWHSRKPIPSRPSAGGYSSSAPSAQSNAARRLSSSASIRSRVTR